MTSFNASSAASTTASVLTGMSTTHTSRRWVRREIPMPFLWAGLWPLLGLLLLLAFALGPLAKNRVEKSVRNEVRDALDAQGHRWVQMSVSGQNVSLSGVPPTASAGDQAMSVARAAGCPSWAGPLTCAVQVTGQFDPPGAAPPTPSPQLTPAGESLLPAVPQVTPAPAQACERAMADVVANSRIEFATKRSDIAERSAATLDALAEAAKTCNGVIEVQGHTDSIGQRPSNLQLSNARAQSVRQALLARGLPEARITARGFGDANPIADNTTPEGRAQNRRIEFRVTAP
jgi:outer membrane protein OmpA-like peptidoglycan-associated protein